MINYVQKILGAFPEEIENSTTFPGDEYLFQRRDEDYPKADFLPEEQAWGYHCSTAQLLFIFYIGRRDIQTSIAFLTTRLSKPDEDDLCRYINGRVSDRIR